ncbi:MAG: AAA family ATPase, partial [Myxococcota bacterium]
RDLKPSNVLVDGSGRLVLMDFGIIAEMDRPPDPELRGSLLGTPTFMAPEQARGESPSAAADWYSFGVIMYIALTGRRPFEGNRADILRAKQSRDPLPPSHFVSEVPMHLEQLCMQLLARDPGRRPDGLAILDQLGAGTPSSGHRPSVDTFTRGEPELFVGREAELDRLGELWGGVCRGDCQLVLIQGTSGMGKTSLVDQFLRDIRAEGWAGLVATARCNERESLAYSVFDRVIDEISRYLLECSATERAVLIGDDIAAISQLFPTLGRVPGCAGPLPVHVTRPDEVRAAAVSALRQLFDRLAIDEPLVIRVEDLQWADRSSLELLTDVLASPAPEAVLVLTTATVRSRETLDEYLGERLRPLIETGRCKGVGLGPLEADEQQALIVHLSAGGVAVADVDHPVWREAGGNPLLLVELTRFAQELPDQLADIEHMTLSEVIYRRVSLLSERARVLLETIAMAEAPLPAHLLSAAAGLSDDERERAVAVLRIARLARRTSRSRVDPWLDTYHDKIRQAIFAHLSPARQVALHHALASALATWDAVERPVLARHWLAAGEVERAIEEWLAAADHARDQLAVDRAAALYRRALDELEPSLPEAGAPSAEPLERTACRVYLGLADCLRLSNKMDEGGDWARELLQRADAIARRYQMLVEQARLHCLRGALLFRASDVAGCLDEYTAARDCAVRAGAQALEIWAVGGIGDAHCLSGRMITALGYFDRCVELGRATGLDTIVAGHLGLRGWSRFYRLELDAALRDCREASELSERIGHRRAELTSRTWHGMILLEAGRSGEAREQLERAIEVTRSLGAPHFELGERGLLARALLDLGQPVA